MANFIARNLTLDHNPYTYIFAKYYQVFFYNCSFINNITEVDLVRERLVQRQLELFPDLSLDDVSLETAFKIHTYNMDIDDFLKEEQLKADYPDNYFYFNLIDL